MKRKGMRLASIVVALLVSILMCGEAYCWDPATHAYIEENLHKKQGHLDNTVLYNRIYGANALDVFNNNFSDIYVVLAAYMHDTTRDNFLKVWEKAATKAEKAFSYGFVGHNNTWGMDSTAHVSGITFGKREGYVIAKARILASMLKPAFESKLGPVPDPVMVDICHYLVESGVDFLVLGKDPSIGNKLMTAANSRSDEVPELLIKAYSYDFTILGVPNPDSLIASAEASFKTWLWAYGLALTQNNAIDLVSAGLAEVGAAYLGLPPESAEALIPVAKQGIYAAMTLCAPDFEAEIRASTGWINGRLSSHGINW